MKSSAFLRQPKYNIVSPITLPMIQTRAQCYASYTYDIIHLLYYDQSPIPSGLPIYDAVRLVLQCYEITLHHAWNKHLNQTKYSFPYILQLFHNIFSTSEKHNFQMFVKSFKINTPTWLQGSTIFRQNKVWSSFIVSAFKNLIS